MADPVLQSPTNPQFFQPLLPGFDSFLNIPVKFFSVYIEGIYEGQTVELRSDASDITWKVMEGRRLTVGWKDFASAHDFRIGDIIVLRHEGALVFHVTALGPSCCEIQYVQSCNDDDQDNVRNMPMEQSLKTESESSSEEDNKDNIVSKNVSTKDSSKRKRIKSGDSYQNVPSSSSSVSEDRFLTLIVTPSSIHRSRLYLPTKFTRGNKMEKAGGKKITLLDKHGVEWPVTLQMDKKYTRIILSSGLKNFFNAIEVRAYESVVLEVVWEEISTLPMFKFCSKSKT